MGQYNYKCIVTKNGTKMYYKRVKGINGMKWKRISNKVGMKAEKGKRKYNTTGCTNSKADNYNIQATVDDGTCRNYVVTDIKPNPVIDSVNNICSNDSDRKCSLCISNFIDFPSKARKVFSFITDQEEEECKKTFYTGLPSQTKIDHNITKYCGKSSTEGYHFRWCDKKDPDFGDKLRCIEHRKRCRVAFGASADIGHDRKINKLEKAMKDNKDFENYVYKTRKKCTKKNDDTYKYNKGLPIYLYKKPNEEKRYFLFQQCWNNSNFVTINPNREFIEYLIEQLLKIENDTISIPLIINNMSTIPIYKNLFKDVNASILDITVLDNPDMYPLLYNRDEIKVNDEVWGDDGEIYKIVKIMDKITKKNMKITYTLQDRNENEKIIIEKVKFNKNHQFYNKINDKKIFKVEPLIVGDDIRYVNNNNEYDKIQTISGNKIYTYNRGEVNRKEIEKIEKYNQNSLKKFYKYFAVGGGNKTNDIGVATNFLWDLIFNLINHERYRERYQNIVWDVNNNNNNNN